MVAVAEAPSVARMTVQEFLSWPSDGSGRKWQLVDGKAVLMAPASTRHGAIQMEVGGLLRDHLRAQGSHCRVITEPGVSPRLRADWNVRIPDLAVDCSRDDTRHLLAAPLLIVEILSPSNEADTWANMWTYATLPSLQEMLVVRSLEVGALLLRRLPDLSWPERFESIGEDPGIVRLDSIGASFRLREFYVTTSLR